MIEVIIAVILSILVSIACYNNSGLV